MVVAASSQASWCVQSQSPSSRRRPHSSQGSQGRLQAAASVRGPVTHGIDLSELEAPAAKAAERPALPAGEETAAQAALRKNKELALKLLNDDELDENFSLPRASSACRDHFEWTALPHQHCASLDLFCYLQKYQRSQIQLHSNEGRV